MVTKKRDKYERERDGEREKRGGVGEKERQ